MALVIEITAADGAVKEIRVDGENTVVTAAAGYSYRIVSDLPSELANTRIRRLGEDLIVSDLPDGQAVTLEAFFATVGGEGSPVLHLDSLGGNTGSTVTQDSQPIAALTAGGFLLWSGPGADDRQPVAPESEFSWRPIAAVGAAVVVGAGAGGGSGNDNGGIVGSDQTPDTPTIDTDQVTSTKPVISGTGTPGSTITMLIDLGGSGQTVSYETTVDTNGRWSVDTATATPNSGEMPPDGLPLDAPSPIRAVANSAGGNSGLAAGSLEVDQTPPSVTATLDQIESDAPEPTGDTELTIEPGPLEPGGNTNDTSPTLTGTISAPLDPSDVVIVVRNGERVGEATVTGLNWRFTDSGVPAGTHNYAVQVSDPAGNTTPSSAAISINVDGTAPLSPTLDPVTSDDVVTLAEAEAGVLISGSAEANSTVSVQWGAVTQTATADGNGVYSTTFATSSLPGDGRTPVSVFATDSFGNVSESVARPVNVAAGLPAAPIIDTDSALLSGDIAAINAREAAGGFDITGNAEPGTPITVVFSPVNGGQTFEAASVVNNGGQFSVGFANGSVPDGEYEVTASVSDFAGQTVQGPVVSILVDTVAPTSSAAVTGAIDNQPSVTGAMASGAVTNDNTPTITGSVSGSLAANESVLILRDGQPVGTAELNGNQWQFEESALPEGQYVWSALVVDSAGNTGPADNTSLTLTLDLTAPARPSIDALTGDDVVTGADTNGGVQVTGRGPAGGQVQLDWAGQLQTVNVNTAGNWSATFANPPADGRTQITASVVDAAGNRAEAFRTVTVDTQPPQMPGISTVASNDIVNAAEAARGVSIAGTGEAGTRVDVRWANLTETTTVSSAGFWTVNFANVPPDGSTTVTASAVDLGGNRSSDATRSVTVDTTPPTRPVIQVVEGDDQITAAEVADGIAVRGNAEAGSTINVSWASETATTQAGANGTFQVVFSTVPAEGQSTIEVTSTDAAGNISAAGSRVVLVNTTLPPVAPEVAPLASGNVINAAEISNGVTINGTSQAGATISVNWASVVLTTTAATDGNWSVTYAAGQVPEDGTSTIVVSAINSGGNSPTVSLPVTIDTTAPAAPVIQVIAGDDIISAAEAENGVQVQGSAQAGSDVTVNWDGASQTTQANGAGIWTVTFTSVPGNGASTVTATATDSAGNVSDAGSRGVTVNTVPAPPASTVLPVASDNAINAAEAAQGPRFSGSSEPAARITVNWEGATQTTTASGSGAWTVTFAQADIPADGTTSISVIAENAGGQSAPTTHEFVLDTTSPPSPSIAPITGDDIIDATESAGPITINGSAQANTVVRVNWGDATTTANTSANGQWSAVFSALPVSAGDSSIEAIAGDFFGNRSETVSRDVEVITVQPAQTPTIAAIGSDGVINAAQAANGVSLNGQATPGAQISISWGNYSATTVAADNGNWSNAVAATDIPADGDTIVSVTAANAGGVSDPATATVLIDTSAPPAPVVTAIAGDDIISIQEQTEPVLVTGTAAANSVVTVNWGTLSVEVNTNASGAWQATFDALPAGGESELTALATDTAGNNSALRTHTFTIEEPAVAPAEPTIGIISDDDVVNATDTDGVVPISGTADAGTQVTVSWGTASASTATNSAGEWIVQFDAAEIPADGLTTVTAIASTNGQSSTPATRSVTIDTEAPTQLVSIADLIDNEGATGVSIADGDTTTDLTPQIVLDLDSTLDPTDTIVLTMDGDTLLTLTAGDDFSVELGPLAEGAHTFTAQVIDAAQNAGVVSDPLTVIFEQAQGLNGAA